MKHDYFFNFYSTRGLSWQQRAEFNSTLVPLRLFIPKKTGRKTTLRRRKLLFQRLVPRAKLKRATGRLLMKQAVALHARWRQRIQQLQLESDPPRLMQFANRCLACKPAFFNTSGRRYYCRVSVCPYCHARTVYNWFRRLAAVLNQHSFKGTLVLRRVKYVQPLLDVSDNLAAAVNLAKADAKYYWRRSGAAAGLSFVQLIPGREVHGCTVVTNQLLYYLGDAPVEADYVKVVTEINLRSLQTLVCKALRYPPEWFYRKPQHALRVFTVLRNRNLITANGLFYKVNKEEIDDFDLRAIEPIFKKADRHRLGNGFPQDNAAG